MGCKYFKFYVNENVNNICMIMQHIYISYMHIFGKNHSNIIINIYIIAISGINILYNNAIRYLNHCNIFNIFDSCNTPIIYYNSYIYACIWLSATE